MMAAALEQQPPFNKPAAGGPTNNAAASITPPQSANGKKEVPEGVPSELSDLELDPKNSAAPEQEHASSEEDEEEIEPDHYYGGGKIPVFKPVCCCNMRRSRVAELTILGLDYGPVSGFPKVHQQG